MLLLGPVLLLTDCFPGVRAAAAISATGRGVVVETERYRAEIVDGALTGFVNKLTGEEYLSGADSFVPVRPHIMAGLGTQNGAEAFAMTCQVYLWPWNNFPVQVDLPNQHFADDKSSVTWKSSAQGGVLTYRGLSDGRMSYPDETFALTVAVDPATGDLLITPSAASPRTGVYGANFTAAPTNVGVSVEAPIFDGITITPDMRPELAHNKWPDFWDYAFVALNGARRGAVGIWAEDTERRYKDLFFMPTPDLGGIALSFGTMNVPPFDKLTQAQGVTWRLQAFDKSWAQAAARFRDWRAKSREIAPRPAWTQHVSFVNNGVNAGKNWLDTLSAYLNGEHLERTVTFAPVVRAAAFDTRHWDNTPYADFKSDMSAWKVSGGHLMAYLQPMIMWGTAPKDDVEAQKIVAMDQAANTESPFQATLSYRPFIDQHHLGEPAWQTWFLHWVHAYIQDDGADGVYHDQSYLAPVDGRGLINGMTPPQGMADYFYKAATQNPDAIEGTEHLQECNSVGVSLGIGSGILWGTAPDMRRQRQLHPSSVSNALAYPAATLYGFPHFSDFGTHGDATLFHWGMDLMEGRGDLPGLALQDLNIYPGKRAPYDSWVNELKMDRDRVLLFVHYGLRPVYPDDRNRHTLSYFQGANGEDFRYEKLSWGSRFVQVVNDHAVVQYARAHGDTHAPGATTGGGNVAGWVFYNDVGPSGFHPDRYYVLDPVVARPPVYFSPGFQDMPGGAVQDSFYEHYLEDGSANDQLAYMDVKPIPSIGNIIRRDKVILHTPTAPFKIWVNGQEVPLQPVDDSGQKVYPIDFESPASICVLLKEPVEGFDNLDAIKSAALVRSVSSVNLDVFKPSWLATEVVSEKIQVPGVTAAMPGLTLHGPDFPSVFSQQIHLPLKAPSTAKGGVLKVHLQLNGAPLQGWSINGVAQDDRNNPLLVPFKAGESKVLAFSSSRSFSIALEWNEMP